MRVENEGNMSVDSFKIGVIVIGSLLWDNDYKEKKGYRKKWRITNFSDERIMILAPIRYGRESGENKNYTMIYDAELNDSDKMGTAYVCPVKKSFQNLNEIFEQVELLSLAEGFYDVNKEEPVNVVKGKKNQWAVISYLLSPKLSESHKKEFRQLWRDRTNISLFDSLSFHEHCTSHFCDENGEIQKYWPSAVSKDESDILNSFDILITTCTKRNVKTLPTSEELYEDFNTDTRKYIKNNILNGIFTFQDISILNNAHNK